MRKALIQSIIEVASIDERVIRVSAAMENQDNVTPGMMNVRQSALPEVGSQPS